MIYIIFIVFAVISWLIQKSLQNKIEKYSRYPLPFTGKQIAEKMLQENGITDVTVGSTEGSLTDHYNPANKTVNLSEVVYNNSDIAAAAIAAHECGHAVQHAKAYAWLTMRSKLVPIVNFSSKYMTWVLLAGVLLIENFPIILEIGIAMFATTTLFAFITLPVEIDASKRAIAWLEETSFTDPEKMSMAKDALRTAAYTYVVAALGSLATLLYYILIAMRRR